MTGNRTTQVRGGTGVFTGKPAYVWISNQIGNTGVLTGFEPARQHDGAAVQPEPRRLQADDRHRRAGRELSSSRSPTRTSSSRRSGGATSRVDQRLPVGPASARSSSSTARTSTACTTSTPTCRRPQTTFAGADTRPRAGHEQPASTPTVANAVVLKNQNVGSAWNVSGSAREDASGQGFTSRAATATARRRTPSTPARSPFGSWTGNPHPGDPEQPGRRLLRLVAGPPRLRWPAQLPLRVPQVRRDDGLGLLRGLHQRQHQLHLLGRPERRRRHEQRPDLHPARPVRDELPDVHVGRRAPSPRPSRRRPGTPTSTRTRT